MCSPDHIGTHYIDQDYLEFMETEPPAFAYQALLSKASTTLLVFKLNLEGTVFFSLWLRRFFLIHISKLILSLGTLSLSFWSQIVCKGIKEREVGSRLHLEVPLQMGEDRMLTDDVIGVFS